MFLILKIVIRGKQFHMICEAEPSEVTKNKWIPSDVVCCSGTYKKTTKQDQILIEKIQRSWWLDHDLKKLQYENPRVELQEKLVSYFPVKNTSPNYDLIFDRSNNN